MPRRRRHDPNGAAWRKLRAAVLASEDVCALCGRPVDKALHYLDPLSPQIDHIVPVSQGGQRATRSNLQLTHRVCNRRKGDGKSKTLEPIPTSRKW